MYGSDEEMFFPPDWEAGQTMQLDWTNVNELAVKIAGRPYESSALPLPAAAFELGGCAVLIGVATVGPAGLAGGLAPVGQGASGTAD